MACVLCEMNRWDEALAAAQESADLFRDMGSRHGLTNALQSIAAAMLGQGEVDQALDHFNESMALALQLNAEAEVLSMLVLGAQLLHACGRDEDAARVLVSIQRNAAAAMFTLDSAAMALRDLPPAVVASVEGSREVWTVQQVVEALRAAAMQVR